MFKPNKNHFTIGILILIVGVCSTFISACGDEFLYFLYIGIFFILFGVSLMLIYKISVSKQNRKQKEITSQQDFIDLNFENSLPQIFSGYIIKKYCSDYLCFLDDSFPRLSEMVNKEIYFEPVSSRVNNNSIAVNLTETDERIGYVYNGKTQNDINEWISSGKPVIGKIIKATELEFNKPVVIFQAGFYDTLANFDFQTFPIIKTDILDDLNTKRSENLIKCKTGSQLLYEKNPADNTYVLTDTNSFREVGELPKSAIRFIEQTQGQKIILLDNIEPAASDTVTASVKIYTL